MLLAFCFYILVLAAMFSGDNDGQEAKMKSDPYPKVKENLP